MTYRQKIQHHVHQPVIWMFSTKNILKWHQPLYDSADTNVMTSGLTLIPRNPRIPATTQVKSQICNHLFMQATLLVQDEQSHLGFVMQVKFLAW